MTHISISIKTNKSIATQSIIPTLCNEKIIIDVEKEGVKIVHLVSENLKISPELIMHHSRCQVQIAKARQLAMYLLHVCVGCSMSSVGRFFGRDRTTVSHACNKIEDMRDDDEYDDFVAYLEAEFEIIPTQINDNSGS